MADPYNPYAQYPTPTPGGVGYYPPEQAHSPAYASQQPYEQPYEQPYNYGNAEHYGSAEPQQDMNYTYGSQPQNQYHLAPEAYSNGADRSYTPVGQPDYQGPVTGPVTGVGVPAPHDKVPENLGYYDRHPADQPRYSPAPSPRPPCVRVSEAPDENEGTDLETDRGLGSSLAGGAAGYYFGHKKEHGLLGAIGGAIVANMVEHKVKDHRDSSPSGREHGHHGHHGHHHHHHHHGSHHGSHHSRSRSRSRSHSRHHGDDEY